MIKAMKYLVLLLTFFLITKVSGQCVNPFQNNKAKWEEIEVVMSNEEKANLLGKQNDRFGKNYLDPDEYYDQFHPLFLNSDSRIDIIYVGQHGGEGTEVDIMINTGNGFRSIKSELGGILNIFKLGPNSGYIIHFLQYGCCDDPQNSIATWTLTEVGTNIQINTTNKIYYLEGTELPKCFDINLKFEVLNSPYTLRATTEINNSPGLIHNYEQGNIIAEFKEGDTGTAVASKTDETGRVWWFVIMDPPEHNNLFHNYAIYRKEQWSGWMSSRFVKVFSE